MSAGICRSNPTPRFLSAETERSRLALRNRPLALATLRVSTNLRPQKSRSGKEDGAGVVMSDILCWCVLQFRWRHTAYDPAEYAFYSVL